MPKKKLIISICNECGFSIKVWDRRACSHPAVMMKNRRRAKIIKESPSGIWPIPAWCPLPDATD